MSQKLILIFFLFFSYSVASAGSVEFGAFVDGYYAFDTASPDTRDRAYTTQPARHDEFNINLAFVDVQYSNSDELKARVALQVGTSVEANYATEPTLGIFSNEDMVKFIQEAYVGVKVAERTWVYGGIFFSHIGYGDFYFPRQFDLYSLTGRRLLAFLSVWNQVASRVLKSMESRASRFKWLAGGD